MKYEIMVDVESAEGWQLWRVEANSKEAALKKFNDGGGDCICENVEVTSLCKPTLGDVTEYIEPRAPLPLSE